MSDIVRRRRDTALYSRKHTSSLISYINDRFVRPNFEDVPDPVVVRLAGMENERELEHRT